MAIALDVPVSAFFHGLPQDVEQLPKGEALFIEPLEMKIAHALSKLTDRKIKFA
jgi:hypothetical protein